MVGSFLVKTYPGVPRDCALTRFTFNSGLDLVRRISQGDLAVRENRSAAGVLGTCQGLASTPAKTRS